MLRSCVHLKTCLSDFEWPIVESSWTDEWRFEREEVVETAEK
jgi:hypothetical protein